MRAPGLPCFRLLSPCGRSAFFAGPVAQLPACLTWPGIRRLQPNQSGARLCVGCLVLVPLSVLQAPALLSSPRRLCPGHHIAQLPVDARIGKLLLVGTVLGCLSPVLTIAACLSYKSPFQSSYDQQNAMEQARAGFAAAGALVLLGSPHPVQRAHPRLGLGTLGGSRGRILRKEVALLLFAAAQPHAYSLQAPPPLLPGSSLIT